MVAVVVDTLVVDLMLDFLVFDRLVLVACPLVLDRLVLVVCPLVLY